MDGRILVASVPRRKGCMPATNRIKEGSKSFLMKCFTGALQSTEAIQPSQMGSLTAEFLRRVQEDPNTEYLRHASEVLQDIAPLPKKCSAPTAPTAPLDEDFEKMFADDFGLGIDQSDRVEDPFTGPSSELHTIMGEWIVTKAHPFAKMVTIAGKKYGVVGTCKCTTADRSRTYDINCTTGNYRKLKDADESVLVFHNGRPVSLAREVGPNRFFLWLVHVKPNLTVRFWANIQQNGQRSDHPNGNHRLMLTPSGWVSAG